MNIKHIHIQNFKSIRDLELDVRRVNVFIGEPNTGKTNVLEALSLLSENTFRNNNLKQMIRFQSLSDLFWDINRHIRLDIDSMLLEMEVSKEGNRLGAVKGKIIAKNASDKPLEATFEIKSSGTVQYGHNDDGAAITRRYIFDKVEKFEPLVLAYLNPPFGDNLPQILSNHSSLRKQVSEILRDRGFKLLLKPVESEIHIAREVDDELFSYPFPTISETWKRIIFLLAILETNKNQVLILDEPEANIFPFFNAQIAETIGLHNSNQFFITTHNPYMLQSLITKTPKDDLCVFVTRMENFETKVHQMDAEQLSEAIDLGSGIFFNLGDLATA